MAQPLWKLVVTNLGTQAIVLEADVYADNWLAALRAGRDQLGDPGMGVPTGASCVVSGSGEVNILDGANRRRYTLTPVRGASLPVEPDVASSAPPAPSPAPEPTRGPSPAELAARADAARENARERADAAPPHALSYASQRADALRREFESRRPPAPANNVRSLPTPSSRASSTPPPQLDRLMNAVRSRPPRVVESEQPRLVQAFARDMEPTPRSPITYRERAYVVMHADDLANLEGLLQAELLKLRNELSAAPRGQLIHLAAFDKPFSGTPSEPPIATLEWSDWRGNAVYAGDNARPSQAVTSAPRTDFATLGVGEIPAPGSHVAPIPRALSAHGFDAATPSQPPPSQPPPARPSGAPPKQTSGSPWDALRAATSSEGRDARMEEPAPIPPAAPLPELASASDVAPEQVPAPPSWIAPSAPVELPAPLQSSAPRVVREDTGEHDNRLAQAFEALPDLYFLPTPVAGLEFATKLIARLVPCEASSICLYDIDTDEFRFVAVSGIGANERRAYAVPSQAGLFGASKWTVEDAFIVPNVEADPRYQPAVDGRPGLDMLNLAYVPLRKGNALLGMMQLINRAGDLGFTTEDVAVLHYVSTQLTEFIISRRNFD